MIRTICRDLKHRYQEGMINFRGKGVVNFIDVGSYGKLPDPWDTNSRFIRNLLRFEPRDKPSKRRSVETLNVPLWEEKCERDFYICRSMSGSSLLEQNVGYVRAHFDELKSRGPRQYAETWFERAEVIRTERLTCHKLDDILSDPSRNHVPFHFMKLDTQGAEYNILKGAERFLAEGCLGLQLELFVVPMYKGVKLLDEMVDFLDTHGFELAIKYPAQGTFECAHDCVFLRRGGHGQVMEIIRRLYGLQPA